MDCVCDGVTGISEIHIPNRGVHSNMSFVPFHGDIFARKLGGCVGEFALLPIQKYDTCRRVQCMDGHRVSASYLSLLRNRRICLLFQNLWPAHYSYGDCHYKVWRGADAHLPSWSGAQLSATLINQKSIYSSISHNIDVPIFVFGSFICLYCFEKLHQHRRNLQLRCMHIHLWTFHGVQLQLFEFLVRCEADRELRHLKLLSGN